MLKKLFSVFVGSVLLFTPSKILASDYYVSPSGVDTASGSLSAPWKTITKAVSTVVAGDTIYIRAGTYPVIWKGWNFKNSGTASAPITVRNFAGEQVLISLNNPAQEYSAFRCWYANPAETTRADYIKVLGSNISTRTLSNGLSSNKGIVMQGVRGNGSGFETAGCDNWEIAGIDFVDVPYGVFAKNRNFDSLTDYKSDNYYVHDNRVYGFFNESGMQFNGNNNRIENNFIAKVSNINDTPWGCQMLNLLGNGNVVRGNTLSNEGSTAGCLGLLLEWDLSDSNLIEQNTIIGTVAGLAIAGGDNNIIRNNVIYQTGTPVQWKNGLSIASYENRTDWPCDESTGAKSITPANNPLAPNYANYYNPRNCLSYGNQVYNNTIHGYDQGIQLYPLTAPSTVIRNNALSGWTRAGLCFYDAPTGGCKTLPSNVTASNNLSSGTFGYVNPGTYDFHLTSSSPLINSGYTLTSLVPTDKDGINRPQGTTHDVGAYEYVGTTPTPTPTPSPTPSPTPVADTVAPIVKITRPVSGATVTRSKTKTINATAIDNIKVTKLEYYINGVLKCSTSTVTSCKWSVPSTRSTTYTILVKGYDAAGNTGTSTVTVKSSK